MWEIECRVSDVEFGMLLERSGDIQHPTLLLLSPMLLLECLQAALDFTHVQKQTDPHDERWYCGQNLPSFHLDLSMLA